MASKEQIIGEAQFKKDDPKESRVDLAWLKAEVWLKSIDVKVTKPDFDEIIAAMTKAKSGMAFVASFDGQWLTVTSRVGSKNSQLSQIDVSGGKDDAKWRAAMLRLKEKTQLVTDADWAKFQKEHPDPAVVAKLRARISALDTEIKALQDNLKAKLADRELAKKALTAMGVK